MYDLITADNWMQFGYWTVAIFAVVAAWIDGTELKVPNKLTLPFVAAGWIFTMIAFELQGDAWYYGLGYSLLGTAVGCLTLLPFYAIGAVSYTHLRAHETDSYLVCRLLLEKKKK